MLSLGEVSVNFFPVQGGEDAPSAEHKGIEIWRVSRDLIFKTLKTYLQGNHPHLYITDMKTNGIRLNHLL